MCQLVLAYDSWGLQWAGQDLSGFTKLKFFHYRRRKELEDIPDQSTAPPFPSLKYHILLEKPWDTLSIPGQKILLGTVHCWGWDFLVCNMDSKLWKRMAMSIGQTVMPKVHTKPSKSLRSSSHVHLLVVSSYPPKQQSSRWSSAWDQR